MKLENDEKEKIQKFLIAKCEECIDDYNPTEEKIYQKLLVIVTIYEDE